MRRCAVSPPDLRRLTRAAPPPAHASVYESFPGGSSATVTANGTQYFAVSANITSGTGNFKGKRGAQTNGSQRTRLGLMVPPFACSLGFPTHPLLCTPGIGGVISFITYGDAKNDYTALLTGLSTLNL